MKEVGVGLLGFGTVGAGVVEGLQKNGDLLTTRLGVRPVLRKIADLDIERDRGVAVDRALLTQDAASVINDPDIPIIVELVGGTGIARKFVNQALAQGKAVVTANKALLAEHGAEIFQLAREKQAGLHFGASVGGGIPIIRSVRDAMIGNRIETVHGILNGTCNYILTRMEQEQMKFDRALKEAQKEGYAEAEPSLDIDGFDTAHKAVILASLACGKLIPMNAVQVEGIRTVGDTDIRYALDLGYRIKLLAVIRQQDGKLEVRVHPALVPLSHVLASIMGVFNGAMVKSDLAGNTLYYGRGAGRQPTASTVISDIADAARNILGGTYEPCTIDPQPATPVAIRPADEIESRYYLRLSLLDKPGVLAKVATILGNHHIGIASVLQKESAKGRYVPAVILTDAARGRAMEEALQQIDTTDAVNSKTVRFRIVE